MADTAHHKIQTVAQRTESRSRPIDLVYLARQTLGDPALEAEILTLFSTMAKTYLGRVKGDKDKATIEHGLHSLKGAAAGIGAAGIASEAAAAELELRETGKLSAERLADLGMAVEEVQVFIASLLAE